LNLFIGVGAFFVFFVSEAVSCAHPQDLKTEVGLSIISFVFTYFISTFVKTSTFQVCYNWILDNHSNQVQDSGGPVVPKADCPHVAHHVDTKIVAKAFNDVNIMETTCEHYSSVKLRRRVSRKRLRSEDEAVRGYGEYGGVGRLKCDEDYEEEDDESEENGGKAACAACPKGEIWLCLECGVLLCSRYANGHAKVHWEDTKSEDSIATGAIGKAGVNYEGDGEGHCIAVSLADLSVWCYECNAYLQHPSLEVLTRQLEEIKFGSSEDGGDSAKVGDEGVQHEKVMGDTDNNNNNNNINGGESCEARNITISTARDANDNERDKAEDANEIPSETQNKSPKNNRKGEPRKLAPEQMGTTVLSFSCNDNSDANNQHDSTLNEGVGRRGSDSSDDDPESHHQAEIIASLLQSEHGEAIRAYLARHESFDPGNMSQCVPMHMPAPPTFPGEMADFLQSPLCKSIIVLAGAGMSVSSGIPDFRSAGVGLYDTLRPELLTASELEQELIRDDPTLALDKGMFLRNPLPMLELKRDFILGTQESRWKATLAHRFVELLHSKLGKLTRWYTQNIDGLEMQCKTLPKEKVVPVHGSMGQAACEYCEAPVDFDEFCSHIRGSVKDITGCDIDAPRESTPVVCEECGHPTVKPTIVLFRGSMPKEFHVRTAEDLPECDLLIIIGTSLTVAPANSLVYRVPPTSLRLVMNNERVGRMLGINYSEDSVRDVFAHGHSDEMCLELADRLGWLKDLEQIIDELPESSAQLLRDRLAQKLEEE
jgi:NAD-dependent deacetylase sirtuin 2